MTATGYPGPLSIEGLKPPMLGPQPYVGGRAASGIPENPDAAPALMWMGMGVRDPRYMSRIGAGANVAGGYPLQDVGWLFVGGGMLCCDFVPSAPVANNLVAAAATVALTPMTLAAASTGITVAPAGGVYVPGGMQTIPAGALIIDGSPSYTGSGQSGGFAFWNPATGASRAIGVTSTAGGTVSFKINGFDLYGYPQTETLVANGTAQVLTKKTYKAFSAPIPATTDAAHTYTFGTVDIYGFAIAARSWPMVQIYYGAPPAQVLIALNTGFVAADNTAPSLVTGDVRGTYALQSAADGTNRLTMIARLPFGVIASTYANAVIGLLGQTPT